MNGFQLLQCGLSVAAFLAGSALAATPAVYPSPQKWDDADFSGILHGPFLFFSVTVNFWSRREKAAPPASSPARISVRDDCP